MNLETLQNLWKEDCNIDDDLYCEESLKIPRLHQKYMEYFNTFSLMKKEKEGEYKRIVKEKWLYYKGKAPATVYKEMPFDLKLTTKEEINMFIEADEDIRRMKYKIDYLDQVIFFLESVIKQISVRNFQIKNAIDWTKWKEGS